jgi:hypothetical protein
MELKLAIVAILVAAAFFGRTEYLIFTLAALAFGAVNVFIDIPGTLWVRAIAVLATFVTLLRANTLLLLLFALTWPPAFAVAWALAEQSATTRAEAEAQRDRIAITPRSSAVWLSLRLAPLACRCTFRAWRSLRLGVVAQGGRDARANRVNRAHHFDLRE